jgi:hypothetical protein
VDVDQNHHANDQIPASTVIRPLSGHEPPHHPDY